MQHVQLIGSNFHMLKMSCIIKHFSEFVILQKIGNIFAEITSKIQISIVSQELAYPYKIIWGPFLLHLVYYLLTVLRVWWGFSLVGWLVFVCWFGFFYIFPLYCFNADFRWCDCFSSSQYVNEVEFPNKYNYKEIATEKHSSCTKKYAGRLPGKM